MLVGERMSRPVISVQASLSVPEALDLMRKERIRRLPVVNSRGELVGIVSERDLLHAAPSDATTLSMWEIPYLFSKIQVSEVMTTEVITVSEDTPIETAAWMMTDHKIGGLPVVRGKEVVGMITETDIFKMFLELLGARKPGVRLSVLVPDVPGELAELSQAIYQAGGNIISLGTFQGDSPSSAHLTIKVDGIEPDALRESVEAIVIRIADLRRVPAV